MPGYVQPTNDTNEKKPILTYSFRRQAAQDFAIVRLDRGATLSSDKPGQRQGFHLAVSYPENITQYLDRAERDGLIGDEERNALTVAARILGPDEVRKVDAFAGNHLVQLIRRDGTKSITLEFERGEQPYLFEVGSDQRVARDLTAGSVPEAAQLFSEWTSSIP